MSAAEKLEVVQATDLVVINATPAAIAFNFEETKAWLENELKQYDVVVTADTLPGSKKLATELNKMAGDIGKRRRDAVAAVSGPIKLFEEQAKALEKMCKDGRQRLLDQVKTFEDETRAKAKSELERCRLEAWDHHGVSDEFRNTVIDDLIKISALTKTGNLTASTANEVGNRVQADKQLQQQTEMRLLHLENQSYKAGLAAPLSRAHVETFLFARDDEYDQRLSALLESERERERVAEERSRKRFEEEQRRAEEEAQRKAEAARRQAEAEQQVQQQVDQPEPEQPAPHQHERQPVCQPEPAPVAQAAQRHAYGPLDDPRAAAISECTQAEAETQAAQLSANAMNEPFGIWVPGQLIAIAFGGEVFRKAG